VSLREPLAIARPASAGTGPLPAEGNRLSGFRRRELQI